MDRKGGGMEHSTEKTELTKRRVFPEHILLLIEGRLLLLLFIGTTGFMWYLFFRDTPALLLVEVSLYYGLLRQFWYRCFG